MTISAYAFLLFGALLALLISGIQANMDTSKFLWRGMFSNKLYYISRASFPGFHEAQDWCSANGGGYPVEINSLEEFEFLEFRVKQNRDLRVYIAGTDAQRDGTWLSQRTGEQLNIFDWQAGEPNNYQRQEDCLELLEKFGGRMNDIACDNVAVTVNVLCEV